MQGKLLKHGGKQVIEILHDICNKILITGIWPEDWTTSILIKKKVSLKRAHHRTILHLSVMQAK